MSAGAAIRQLRAATEGVRYLDDGWSAIVDALAERARALGVVIDTGARAASIEVRGGAAVAVLLKDGRRLECDAVVSTLSPKATVRLLGDHAPARAPRVRRAPSPP